MTEPKNQSDKDNDDDNIPTLERKLREKKPLPSVSYLLKHGDPETAHLPKTWAEIVGYPLALAMVFALSLFMFHNAPWEKLPRRKAYTLPRASTSNVFDQKQQQKAKRILQDPPTKPNTNTEL